MEGLSFLPVDVNTTEPTQGGRAKYPEGLYVVVMEDATHPVTEKAGTFIRLDYVTRIQMGPGQSQEYAGKKFTFGYRINDVPENQRSWNGRHMAVAVACLGSVEAVRQMAQQYQGQLPGQALHGRPMILEIDVNGNFNNVVRCLPYTQQTWLEETGGAPQGAGQQLAPPPQMPTAPPAPMAPQAPTQFQAPQAPQFPQQAAPQFQAPQAPMAPPAPPAPAAPAAPPAPPPPPGVPAR